MTNSTLKWIAIVTMLIDHMGATFFEEEMIFRFIGRLSFPLFAFLISEGVRHTRDIQKYIKRLVVFALISEIPFDLMTSGKIINIGHQNIFFTLALGVVTIEGYRYFESKQPYVSYLWLYILAFIAELLHFDYGMFGVFIIFFVSYGKTIQKRAIYLVMINFIYALVLYLGTPVAFYQVIGCFSALFIVMYNGQKGKGIKYLFYGIYPLHLLLFYLLTRIG